MRLLITSLALSFSGWGTIGCNLVLSTEGKEFVEDKGTSTGVGGSPCELDSVDAVTPEEWSGSELPSTWCKDVRDDTSVSIGFNTLRIVSGASDFWFGEDTGSIVYRTLCEPFMMTVDRVQVEDEFGDAPTRRSRAPASCFAPAINGCTSAMAPTTRRVCGGRASTNTSPASSTRSQATMIRVARRCCACAAIATR